MKLRRILHSWLAMTFAAASPEAFLEVVDRCRSHGRVRATADHPNRAAAQEAQGVASEPAHRPIEHPPVAVVIPCFNAAAYVGEAIESARAQTYSPVEIVVVDDGSTDDSGAVASKHAGVKLVQQPNQGVSVARNRGLAEASSDFVVFLDADDRLFPTALEAGIAAFRRDPEAGLVYGCQRFIGRNAESIEGPKGGVPDAGYARFLAGDPFVPMGCAMFRRSAVERVGGFRRGMVLAQDYDLCLRVARECRVVSHGAVVVEYRLHEGNRSGRLGKSVLMRNILTMLRSHEPLVKGDARLEAALDQGLRLWKRRLSRGVCLEVMYRLSAGQVKPAAKALWTLMKLSPTGLRHFATEPVRFAGRAVRRGFRA